MEGSDVPIAWLEGRPSSQAIEWVGCPAPPTPNRLGEDLPGSSNGSGVDRVSSVAWDTSV